MKVRGFTLFILPVIVLVGCGITKPTVEHIVKDSTVVHYKDSTIYKDSVVYVNVPKESESSILPTDKKSHLETSLAQSDAWVDSIGLHHTLQNKHWKPIPVIVQNTTHIRDNTIISSKSDSLIRTVYREKELDWWQKFRLKSFWWLLALLIIENVILIFAIKKRFIFK